MAGIWEIVQGLWRQNATQQILHPLPPERIHPGELMRPIQAGSGYFRIVLSDHFVTRSRDWFRGRHPGVYTEVKLQYGTSPSATVARLVRADPGANERLLSNRGVFRNYALTELLPYRGGDVSVSAGLLTVPGNNSVKTAFDVLLDVSKVVAAPLTPILQVSSTVADGMLKLLGSGETAVHLGMHTTAADLTEGLVPGYLAAVDATEKELPPIELCVVSDQLRRGLDNKHSQPIENFSYMLFKVETATTRSGMLPDVRAVLTEAIVKLISGDAKEADALGRSAIVTAFRSPDLSNDDRWLVARAIREEIRQLKTEELDKSFVADPKAVVENLDARVASALALPGELPHEAALDQLLDF
jgi:hypothetical protein